MNSSAFSFLSDLVLVLLLFIQVPSSSSNDDLFTACSKNFVCGGVSAGFPFWGNDRSRACGVPELELRCEDNDIAKMNISQVAYRVLEINQAGRILRIAREDSFVGFCPPQLNSTFNPKVFEFVEDYENLTFIYGCKYATTTLGIPFTCKINEVNDQGGYIQVGDIGPGECNRSVLVPVSITDWQQFENMQGLEEFLRKGFEVRWKVDWKCWECIRSKGACGIDFATNKTTCYSPSRVNTVPTRTTPITGSSWSHRRLHIAVDLVLVLLLFIQVPSSSSNDDLFTACSKQFECGGVSAGFPFWGNDRSRACGVPELELRCENNDIAKMNISQVAYRVLEINPEMGTLRIAREDSIAGFCPPQFMNSTFNPNVFESDTGGYTNLTIFYGCKNATTISAGTIPFTCKINEVNDQGGYIQLEGDNGPGECNRSVLVPGSVTYWPPILNLQALEEDLKKGFEVTWKVDREACWDCIGSLGVCGIDKVNQTTCYCPNQSSGSRTCAPAPAPAPAVPARGSFWSRRQLHIVLGISAAMATIITFSVIIICLTRRKGSFSAIIAMIFRPKNSQHVDSVETFMMDNHSFAPKRYSYSNIKKMTSSFVNILGQGGFGNVYRGKLPDGRLVAIKVLKEAKGDGEEFMNEVASISRTSHVNVVTLLGFCYERNKRALIYEFMPNGSLDSFIFDKGSRHTNYRLEWKKLYKIAIGIARGLEYLHRGCNTRIVHFDIKPHNILLDKDFCPKISDFGLAKLCQSKVSKISMIGARGTVGYIAPEVFCRSVGGVTYKSDVYSYGMMVLDMVGQSKDFDMGSLETHEMYFPDWFYMYLEPGKISTLHGGTTKEEEEIVEKMILVGLWCIQTIPSHRPSMTKVIEMFEGSLQSLQIPPRPSFSSPRRSAQEQSSIISSLPCM
ncbi:hypothetical protein NC652_038490 [Populus alba x Populus x berolinensis]|nr:hypothetical protein NC652_038490 [Populus alba x Populus x berolinensis]